jgi:hypothetical protein
MNPLSRLLASVLAAVALIGALFFGVFVFLTAVGLGLVAWAVLWLRIWWIRRRAERSGEFGSAGARPRHSPQSHSAGGSGEVIEGEYTVVSESERERDESKAPKAKEGK